MHQWILPIWCCWGMVFVSHSAAAGSFSGWAKPCQVESDCPEYHTCEEFDHYCVDGVLHGTHDCNCGLWNDFFTPADLVCNCLDCEEYADVPRQHKKLCLYNDIPCASKQDCPDSEFWECATLHNVCFINPLALACESKEDCPDNWYCLKLIPPDCEHLLLGQCTDGKPNCGSPICGNGMCLPKGWLGMMGQGMFGMHSTVDFAQDGYPEYQTEDGYTLVLEGDVLEREVVIDAGSDMQSIDSIQESAGECDASDGLDVAVMVDAHTPPDAGAREPAGRSTSCAMYAARSCSSGISAFLIASLVPFLALLNRRRFRSRHSSQ